MYMCKLHPRMPTATARKQIGNMYMVIMHDGDVLNGIKSVHNHHNRNLDTETLSGILSVGSYTWFLVSSIPTRLFDINYHTCHDEQKFGLD